jgi:hypothetical protein
MPPLADLRKSEAIALPIRPSDRVAFQNSMLGVPLGEVCLSGFLRAWLFGPWALDKCDVPIGRTERLKEASRHSPPFLNRTHCTPRS